MVRSRKSQVTLDLWAAALRDAAGPLSAYITPTPFALENVPLQTVSLVEDQDFDSQIESRLDLGRADAFLRLLEESDVAVATAYQHVLTWSQGAIKGKVHIPRYVFGKARNDRRGVPVLLARRQATTPENLLVSEAFRLSIAITELWKTQGGAEGQYATGIWTGLQAYESAFPWNELRIRARPSLTELVGIVEGRIQDGQVETGSFYEKATSLFSRRPDNLSAFEMAATPISMLISRSPEFEDRVFELLCLAWMISALRSHCSDVVVRPSALRGSRNEPVVSGHFQGNRLALFYQQSAGVLPVPAWVDKRTHRPFRAIPDLVLKIADGTADAILLLDAKNRALSSESEVTYKLMGYKDNLGIIPYRGVGIFPSLTGACRLRRFYKTAADDRIVLAHVPLARGKETVRRLLRVFLSALMPDYCTDIGLK